MTSLWRKRNVQHNEHNEQKHDNLSDPLDLLHEENVRLGLYEGVYDLSIKSDDLSIKLKEHMTPEFTQLLKQCITDGVILVHKGVYKHNDAPSVSDINQLIVTEVLNEIHEWFDFDEPKEKNT
jgi:hypothetical protein